MNSLKRPIERMTCHCRTVEPSLWALVLGAKSLGI